MLFLINLDSAADRRSFMTSQLLSIGMEFTRVGVDMRQQSRTPIGDLAHAEFPQFSFALKNLSGAEVGCWLSHLSSWKLFLERGTAPMCTVIEDDVLLGANFADAVRAVNSQSDYDVIYLGTSSRNLSARRRIPIDRFWAHEPVGAIFNTWGYSITRDYIAKMLNSTSRRIAVPIDHFLGGATSAPTPRIAVLRPAVIEEDPAFGSASQIGPHTLRFDRWRLVERARRRLLSSRMGKMYYDLYRFL